MTPPDSRTIVMLVISAVRYDPRVERSALTLAAAGYKVHVISPAGCDPKPGEPMPDLGPNVTFESIDGGTDLTRYYPWVYDRQLLRAALSHRPLAFHAHDLNTALVGYVASRRRDAYLVCDFHEWYSENVYWSIKENCWIPFEESRKVHLQSFEKMIVRRADTTITVCESIARELEEMADVARGTIAIVRNTPTFNSKPAVHYPDLRDQLEIPRDSLLVLYQGGVSSTRDLENVILALKYSPKSYLVVRGPCSLLEKDAYTEVALEAGAEERLFVLPPVPSLDVVAAAKSADVGIFTIANLCKNFHYSLPNKLFEYLAAGLPVLAGDIPEVRKVLKTHNVGFLFSLKNPKSIADAMNTAHAEPERLAAMRANTHKALADLTAADEWQQLRHIYDGLSAASGAEQHPSAIPQDDLAKT